MNNINIEIWKDISGYEGQYQISNLGTVQSLTRIDAQNHIRYSQIMKPKLDDKGYYQIILCQNGKHKSLSLHRLLAKHFISNPNNLPCINHIDGNPKNNLLENLEWCTYSENTIHAYKTGLMKLGNGHGRAKLTTEQVLEIRKLYKPNIYSFNMLAKQFGVTKQSIVSIVLRRNWKHI
jgi:hypothetical protein